LIKAHIRTADELRDLWASPKAKDALRRRNLNVELVPSYSENTDILDRHLQEDEDDGNDLEEVPVLDMRMSDVEPERSLKRKSEIFEEIAVELPPK